EQRVKPAADVYAARRSLNVYRSDRAPAVAVLLYISEKRIRKDVRRVGDEQLRRGDGVRRDMPGSDRPRLNLWRRNGVVRDLGLSNLIKRSEKPESRDIPGGKLKATRTTQGLEERQSRSCTRLRDSHKDAAKAD